MKFSKFSTVALTLAAAGLATPPRSLAQDGIGARIAFDDLSPLQSFTQEMPDDFAGVTVNEDTGKATVYVVESRRTAALQRLRQRVRGRAQTAADRFALEYRTVARSKAELDEIHQVITEDRSWVTRAGGRLLEWGPDVERNVIEVGVEELTPELVAAARGLFGDKVELFETEPAYTRSRVNDTSPFYSGIDIYDTDRFHCTAGWAIEVISNPANQAMITAGHCYTAGTNVLHSGRQVGMLALAIWANGGYDVGYITGGRYDATTWVGPFNSTTTKAVKGLVSNPFVGMKVCTNGATSGEHCTGKITERNRCKVICKLNDDGSIRECRESCPVSHVVADFDFISTSGDSGGGVFVPATGGVAAVGIQLGGAKSDEVWIHEISNVIPSGYRLRTR